eukprot:1184110-Prorocentrum_minimum.AAC.2
MLQALLQQGLQAESTSPLAPQPPTLSRTLMEEWASLTVTLTAPCRPGTPVDVAPRYCSAWSRITPGAGRRRRSGCSGRKASGRGPADWTRLAGTPGRTTRPAENTPPAPCLRKWCLDPL